MAGAAAGAALGLLGGPIAVIGGAAGGAALTRALKRVGNEMALRMFGPRQQVRVGAAYAIAVAEIARRLESGDAPRADWFIETGPERPAAEELLEGVMQTAGNAYQERKVTHVGLLFPRSHSATTLIRQPHKF